MGPVKVCADGSAYSGSTFSSSRRCIFAVFPDRCLWGCFPGHKVPPLSGCIPSRQTGPLAYQGSFDRSFILCSGLSSQFQKDLGAWWGAQAV